MKKVLGIIGSPRKLGNSEVLIKEISRNVPEPHELSLIRLNDFNILPCKGCYMCLVTGNPCHLDDDLPVIKEAVLSADAFIVAAPAYLLGANASLKRVLDRIMGFNENKEFKQWGKPSIGIAIAGMKGKEGYTKLNIESFLKILLTDIKRSDILYGALPGEIFMNEENKKTAAELGSALFKPAPEITGPRCLLCGGDTFRFLGDNRLQCMLCSNSGTFSMEKGEPVLSIQKSGHDIFLSEGDSTQHANWLTGMKGSFKDHKKKLKVITQSYAEEGLWVLPPSKKTGE
ncbi:MAG: flavodoxin family protein [Desulfobacterales bacterium]|jgi:multimeric flavodoxin WrbA|nr:flavodoxin family protein [Desulfobacteraceae bacterium]MBT7086564.1 flavodoxin family protein [Desulfobacterales bacterium]MBT7697059.1 flavodoxin family protein [Desulfobacterales bacterium]